MRPKWYTCQYFFCSLCELIHLSPSPSFQSFRFFVLFFLNFNKPAFVTLVVFFYVFRILWTGAVRKLKFQRCSRPSQDRSDDTHHDCQESVNQPLLRFSVILLQSAHWPTFKAPSNQVIFFGGKISHLFSHHLVCLRAESKLCPFCLPHAHLCLFATRFVSHCTECTHIYRRPPALCENA